MQPLDLDFSWQTVCPLHLKRKKDKKVIGLMLDVASFHKIAITIAFCMDTWLFSCFSLIFSYFFESTRKNKQFSPQ